MTHRRQIRKRVAGASRRLAAPLRGRLDRSPGHDDLETRLTWVTGSPRTGSTWLLNLLATLTGAAKVDEPLIGAHLATLTSAISGQLLPAEAPLIADVFAERPDYFFSDRHAEVWVPGLRRLVLDRLQASVGKRGRVPVIIKEPNGARGMPILLRVLPSSRLLFLVRDGRDVVDSFLDGADDGWISDTLGVDLRDFGGREGLLRTRAAQWAREIDAVQQCFDAHEPSRRLLLRYEDLRHDTAGELGRVTDWLGYPQESGEIAAAVETFDVDGLPAEQRGTGKFIRAAATGGWRSSFSDQEVSMLNEEMGATLSRLGYD